MVMIAVRAVRAVHAVRALLFPLVLLAPCAVVPGCAPAPARMRGTDAVRAAALPRTVYAAHRGGAMEVPENSMAGLTSAYRRGSADVLDVDVRRLRDGTLVAIHDATLDRTTDHKGPVAALTQRQWHRVRLRPEHGLPGAWRPEHPPTAADVLDRFGGRIVLNVELKDGGGLRRLAALIRKRGLAESVYVQSNDLRLAAKAHRMGLLTSVWRSVGQARRDHPERWRGTVDMLSVDHRARDADIRRAVRSGVRRVWSHTISTPAQRDRVLRLGCDGVLTDAPRLLARTPREPHRTQAAEPGERGRDAHRPVGGMRREKKSRQGREARRGRGARRPQRDKADAPGGVRDR
ncbi:glycerophosphodiester phosphodiesterase [Streptomyces marispadix]|uniref:Glycerophosphodiester phosphodiesterase n=1 Tax=Streptomyces marispadix TaxID=2922868 RepID=A0ABS9SV01_9ACTN|nr:glycerophosphodiester phosphodiesterase family protein [Streptomyces marispadix]MCH6160018.1 glycerophosphodiester phosphodiesterase [Streptomyces marispadix]